MKARVSYDADATCNVVIRGYLISTQVFPTGSALIKVYNKKGKIVRTYQYSKVYSIEKKR